MNFCKKCGSLVLPKKEILKCSCGLVINAETKIVEESLKTEHKEIEIIDQEKDIVNPTIEAICPKCAHDKAEYWTLQTRSSDEPETRFFKCASCKHTWRAYN
jgi:DNA-directed RNA polymerase subunit M